MDRFKKVIFEYFFPFLIVCLGIFISFKNYTPNTFLTGWDALHPEFNFSLAFDRIFSGVWRSDQGLGAIAAHAHMSDLPRVLILWISSLLLPLNFLRYFYIFLTLVIGPLGVYFLLSKTSGVKNSAFLAKFAAFLGATYYLLNLGTLQQFFVPFEMFATQFAFLPWLFLYVWKFLQEGERRNLFILALISLLSAPMAYAPALFYAYFGALVLFLVTNLLFSGSKRLVFKKSLIVLFVIISTNIFWIAPNIYSVVNQSQTINSSKINELFSPEAFLFNKSYGTIDNILINKNFLFSWRGYDFESQ